MWRYAVKFGLVAVALVFLLQISKFSLLTFRLRTELLVAVFALVFITTGVLLSQFFLDKKKLGILDRNDEAPFDEDQLANIGVSQREMDVLTQMAEGKSNKEIGEILFISESTVKTHVSNILLKLGAKRRTEAIIKAKEYRVMR